MSGVLRSLMTRRPGQAYPIDDRWRQLIRDRMERKGMSQAALARASRCSPATISELLSGKSNESPLVPDIHEALDLTPPKMAVLDLNTEELLARWEKLDSDQRQRLLERAAMLAEEQDEKPGKKRP